MKVLMTLLFGGRGGANLLAEIGLLILRLWTGLVLAFAHGINKIPPSERFVSTVQDMGFPFATASAWMAGLGEFVGGILLALGLATRPAAIWIMCVMGTAAFVRHANDPWFAASPSKELALFFMVSALCLLLTGSGRTGIDQFLRRKR